MFEGDSTRVEIREREESIIEVLKERFQEEQCEGDWRISIKEALMEEQDAAELKALKDYAMVRGELYRKMPSGVLPRCVGWVEAHRKLKDVHDKTCESCGEGSLYRRRKLQHHQRSLEMRVWSPKQLDPPMPERRRSRWPSKSATSFQSFNSCINSINSWLNSPHKNDLGNLTEIS